MAIELTEPTDTDLVARFQRGDLAAFEALFERHRRGIYGYALALCSSRETAADAVQDTWLALIESPQKFAAARNLAAYLYAAARNRVMELGRQQSRARKAASELPPLVKRLDPASSAQQAENLRQLNQALDALPQDQKEVVLLRMYEGMKFQEIAQVTGAGIKTVESRYRLALEKLQVWLTGATP